MSLNVLSSDFRWRLLITVSWREGFSHSVGLKFVVDCPAPFFILDVAFKAPLFYTKIVGIPGSF